VTASLAVFELFEAATWVKINVYDKIMTDNQKKRENIE